MALTYNCYFCNGSIEDSAEDRRDLIVRKPDDNREPRFWLWFACHESCLDDAMAILAADPKRLT